MINKDIILKLSNEIGVCSGGIASVLQPYYNLSRAELDNAILENYGFILAYLYVQEGLYIGEVDECISCFIGVNIGNDTKSYHFTTKAFRFYLKYFILIKEKEDVRITSIIIYNLLRPGKRDSFDKDQHIGEVDAIKYISLWAKIDSILHNQIPDRLNPILEKL